MQHTAILTDHTLRQVDRHDALFMDKEVVSREVAVLAFHAWLGLRVGRCRADERLLERA